MTELSRDISNFVSAIQLDDVPTRCVDAAVMGVADFVGVAVAGAREPAARLAAALVAPTAAEDAAPEIGSVRMLAPADAALSNGVAGHALDYDDVAIDGHTSAVLAPAILAEGHALGASGRDALAAYLAGYEVWALLEELEPAQLHERGFHPTAVTGAVATAAACARIRRLDPERTAHAIGVGASLAAGLVANFGTMTKPLHAGRAAQSGVLAARLAASGFTASTDVLEHSMGFMAAHSPSGRPALDRSDWRLGRDWRMETLGINIKQYPICYATHRSIDAMLALVEEHDLTSGMIGEIHVRIGRTQRLMLRNRQPQTGLEAKFSIEFAMASAVVERNVGLAELTDKFVQREDVQALMSRVSCSTTDEILPGMPFAPYDQVSVTLTNGERIEHSPVAHARGSWENPMTPKELRNKFMACAGGGGAALFEALLAIREVTRLDCLPLAPERTPVPSKSGHTRQ